MAIFHHGNLIKKGGILHGSRETPSHWRPLPISPDRQNFGPQRLDVQCLSSQHGLDQANLAHILWLVIIGDCWWLLMIVDDYWCLLMLLVITGVFDVCWWLFFVSDKKTCINQSSHLKQKPRELIFSCWVGRTSWGSIMFVIGGSAHGEFVSGLRFVELLSPARIGITQRGIH